MRRFCITLAVAALLCGAGLDGAAAQRFLPDDPLLVDPDRLDMPPPSAVELSDYWDFIEHTFVLPADYEGPALNVNTLDEVPNSSWYTRRHYWDRMSLEALRRGPDEYPDGPSKEGPWTVVAGKDEGKSAGMQIVDARGDRYFLKFDPPGHIELSTSAEEVVTKVLYALGYHVPQNNVVRFEAERLVPDDENSVPPDVIRAILEKAPSYPDGSYRALSSRFVAGEEILGPFQYHGTRPDDANDIFPHTARRELRGMKVFAAWLNHDDSRSINSLDVVKNVDGRTFVQHYLLDFGTTLGGGPFGPKRLWTGFEYAIDPWRIFLRAISLGFLGNEWLGVEYPGYPSIGHYSAELFEPEGWKPQYPNPAFSRMDIEDAFWAARQVAHFTDEEIRALVSTGQYSNPEAAEYLARTIMARRDIIGKTYLWLGGGLDRFRVREGRLLFNDLLADQGLIEPGVQRTLEWRTYDNEREQAGAVITTGRTDGTSVPIPGVDAPYLQVDLHTRDYGYTRAWLRRSGSVYRVVGIDRAWGEGLPDLEAADVGYAH